MSEIQNSAGQYDPKTVAIVSYITPIGWLVAYFAMYSKEKSSLGGFHLKQTLLLYIIGFAINILMRMFWWTFLYWAVSLLSLGLFVLWLIGLIAAMNGEEKPIPLFGDAAQRMFHNL
jgi:uncharacterized membrane protein